MTMRDRIALWGILAIIGAGGIAAQQAHAAPPPEPMLSVAYAWGNAMLTSGQLPTGRHYDWSCDWRGDKPRSLRCHFDITGLRGVVRRGWWDVVYTPKTRCTTMRFEDRSGRLSFRAGCIVYSMRPDGFRRIPPAPDPAPREDVYGGS